MLLLLRYGSPSMTDIEDFSSAYRACLDEAVVAGAIPDNYSLEVGLSFFFSFWLMKRRPFNSLVYSTFREKSLSDVIIMSVSDTWTECDTSTRRNVN